MNNNLKINSQTKIYILCPSNLKTGGTELLHQLYNILNKNDCKVYMCYYLEGKKASKLDPTPEAFKEYVQEHIFVKEIEDVENNIILFPEVCIGKHRKFKKAQKIIWWLSVDNYHAMTGKINRLKKYGFLSFIKHLIINDYINDKDIYKFNLHLYQSEFARNFLISKNLPEEKLAYLSDYINNSYLKSFSKENREDIVAYNPKKGYEYTQKIINASPQIKYIPIVNMTNNQVVSLLNKAKVYIDFGNHPGKDRIPREAAMSGCCVITNKRGSAKYFEDVAIPDDYKYDDIDKNINNIIKKISLCINDYYNLIDDFSNYRKKISNEKAEFEKCALDIFEGNISNEQ